MKTSMNRWLLIVLTLLALIFSPLGVAPVQAAGPFTHTEVVRMAYDLLPESEMKTLLHDYQSSVLAGSIFPDWGYAVLPTQEGDVFDDYAEYAHWPQFATAYLNYIRRTYSPPYSEEAKKTIAFLFGIISHQMADPPFHASLFPYAQAIDTTLLFGVPGHQDVEVGVDVFNMFDRGCWDLDHIHGCRYKWDTIDWFLPTPAIVSAYAELFDNGVFTEQVPSQGVLDYGWAVFQQLYLVLLNNAIMNGFAYYTIRLPNTHGSYYTYANGGMTNMADLTAARWMETWDLLDYTGPYYVKPSTSGSGDCLRWENACILQTALSIPYGSNEIWVMAGTYKPTTGTDRAAAFQLGYGLSVYGGFAGTEAARDQRDPVANVTILSGDLNGDDIGFTNNGENSYHVVTGATGATLDGFTITAANANVGSGCPSTNCGGGMFNNNSNPTVTNVTFSGNSAALGGGMGNYNSNPSLINVTFSGNLVAHDGGGMYNWTSTPALTNVTFSGNSASLGGGGMFNVGSNPTLTNVTFSDNSADSSGSGMTNLNSSPAIHNTILWGNTAPTGGQIVDSGSSAPEVSYSVVQGGYTSATNIIATDPKLGTLGDYGGFTPTIPILAGSSAIDAGNDSVCPPTDQRGVARPLGSHCDIGAYEYQVPAANFEDVPSTHWAGSFIDRLYAAGITGGCSLNPLKYCPEDTVTRAQMAVFLERGIHGSLYTPPAVGASAGFGDVPINHWAAAWIKQFAADGITAGCGSGNYCPEASVTRAQMAVFLLKAKYGAGYIPPSVGVGTGFADVPTNYWSAAWIKQLAAEGITGGCGSGNYCPESPVTRAQMAVFLVRAFNLP